jgi:hypothetical protein
MDKNLILRIILLLFQFYYAVSHSIVMLNSSFILNAMIWMNLFGYADFTPSYCRDALLSLHQKWLRMAGAEIVDETGGTLI